MQDDQDGVEFIFWVLVIGCDEILQVVDTFMQGYWLVRVSLPLHHFPYVERIFELFEARIRLVTCHALDRRLWCKHRPVSPGGAFISASRMTCSFLLLFACSVHVSLVLSCSKRKDVNIEMSFCFCSVMYCQDSCMPLLCFGDNARMVQFDPTWKELVKRLKEVCAGQKDLLQRHTSI